MHGHETKETEKRSIFWEVAVRKLHSRSSAGFVMSLISPYSAAVNVQANTPDRAVGLYQTLKRESVDPKRSAPTPEIVEKDESIPDEGHSELICTGCGNMITSTGHAIPVEGSHVHRRVNPGGYEHHFRCFSQAPGIITAGQLVYYFSWFSGFGWQMAHCSGCAVHMGWYFAGESTFFGLLVDALSERPTGSRPSA